MKSHIYYTIFSSLAIAVMLFTVACSKEELPSTQEIIKLGLEDSTQHVLHIDTDTLYAQSLLPALYEYNNYTTIWDEYTSQPNAIQPLLTILKHSEFEGLNPTDYHLARIKKMHESYFFKNKHQFKSPFQLVELDVLLSDAFLTLALHLYVGKVREVGLNRDWECFYNEQNLAHYLWGHIQSNTLREGLDSLAPAYPQYHALKKELINYKKELETYSDSTQLQEHLKKIALNMERWRWLPKTTDSTYIVVNIPSFQLWVYHSDSVAVTMKTIVGKKEHPTPSFNCELSYLVFRPRWNVPASIQRKEVLPEVIKDTSYLTKNNFKILNTWKYNDTNYIFSDSILWENATADNFPYKLVQFDGGENPLGKVKFMFPNQFDVYLHDTPFKHLFQKDVRMFSHGCVRIEKANELASFILKNDTLLDVQLYDSLFQQNERRNLKQKIPVFINYWTVWKMDSTLLFLDDVYGKDSILEQVLQEKIVLF